MGIAKFVPGRTAETSGDAAVVLAPWPTETDGLDAAITALREWVPAPDESESRLEAIGEAAAALVSRYAPSAPVAVRNEAVVRTVGWLLDSPAGNIRSESAGPFTTDFAPSQRGAMMHSGAKSLLYPYRSKTAGLAG